LGTTTAAGVGRHIGFGILSTRGDGGFTVQRHGWHGSDFSREFEPGRSVSIATSLLMERDASAVRWGPYIEYDFVNEQFLPEDYVFCEDIALPIGSEVADSAAPIDIDATQ
jgi:hypothetical protein